MITLNQVRDEMKIILKDLKFSSFQVGRINEDKENEIGFYHLDAPTSHYHKFFGPACYRILPIQIIVHGFNEDNDGFRKTETISNRVYEILEKTRKHKSEDKSFEIVNIRMLDNYPRCLWTNKNGIYEFSIECYINISQLQ